MTTSNKNFRVKNGLEVLGTSATVNGNEVLTIASSIAALSDVDLTGAVAGNALVFDASLNLIPGEGSGGGIAKYYVSDTKPLDPEEGIVWYNSVNGRTFIYIVDEDSEQFVEVGTFGPTGATGPQGPAGADGADSTVPGPQGEQGESGIVAQPEPPEDTTVLWYDTDAPGYGIPLGGTSGQVLSKVDSEDFNTEWVTPYSQSNANYDLANVQTAITGDAPLALNTLGKIADAIGDDPDFIGTVNDAIDAKSDIGHVHAISSITNLQAELNNKSEILHDHNNLYYTKGYIDGVLADKAEVVHSHDDLYYTESETDALITNAIDTAITELIDSAPATLDTLNELAASLNDDANFAGTVTTALAGKSDIGHTHDDRYYTETETDTAISNAIAGLIDSAPSTLDTLNELAAALNDDANYAATVSSQLGIITSNISDLQAADIFPVKLNTQTISANYSIPSGYNGISAGPITIDDGVIVTVPSGSSWSIV